ncbi:P-loop containing nucleoside triphosphate hydrolase protein [Rhizoctonia solani]|uniref:P-loop containing nucleoside triphosphate hydrolase protein n=1 Tax=Rhizoctonia solani TaxID=456999 RepID=A0A8H8P356_9AGAM|nr:P-loop containing nucleoside triphosphate hydrolase protein [Rhizoctonia solani]QRW24305.1 P-loop containing nucleoside triphosphate hydrolase protein [Rhizoctonia solani]
MITPQLRPLAPLSGSMTYQHVLEDSGPTDSHSDDYQSLLYAPFISAILSAARYRAKETRSTTRPTRAQRSINIWKVLRLGVCLILLFAIVMLGMAESCPNPDNAKPGATDQVASALAGHGIGKRKKRQHHTNLCLTKEQSTRLSLACFYSDLVRDWSEEDNARAQYGVGFAAAVVRQSKLIIVDETTTSIEYAPDTEFHASLRCALPNATILVITNTLRNIQGVDKVSCLVLEAGHPRRAWDSKRIIKSTWSVQEIVDVDDARDALYVAFTD